MQVFILLFVILIKASGFQTRKTNELGLVVFLRFFIKWINKAVSNCKKALVIGRILTFSLFSENIKT